MSKNTKEAVWVDRGMGEYMCSRCETVIVDARPAECSMCGATMKNFEGLTEEEAYIIAFDILLGALDYSLNAVKGYSLSEEDEVKVKDILIKEINTAKLVEVIDKVKSGGCYFD